MISIQCFIHFLIRKFCVSDIRTVLMVRLGFQPSARWFMVLNLSFFILRSVPGFAHLASSSARLLCSRYVLYSSFSMIFFALCSRFVLAFSHRRVLSPIFIFAVWLPPPILAFGSGRCRPVVVALRFSSCLLSHLFSFFLFDPERKNKEEACLRSPGRFRLRRLRFGS